MLFSDYGTKFFNTFCFEDQIPIWIEILFINISATLALKHHPLVHKYEHLGGLILTEKLSKYND